MAWTSPRTWVSGEVVTAALLNVHLRDNLKAIGDPWTSYTPTWTATTTNPAIGNGSISGRYIEQGKTITFYISVGMGGTTTYGSGRWEFSLPKTAISYVYATPLGRATANDTGTRAYGCDVWFSTTTKVALWRDAGATEAVVTPTTPHTWASTDTLFIMGTYEAA